MRMVVPFWKRVAAKFDRLGGFAADSPRGRVKPHSFHEDAFREFEARNIVHRRLAIAKHFRDFRRYAGLDVRMLAKQERCPGKRRAVVSCPG